MFRRTIDLLDTAGGMLSGAVNGLISAPMTSYYLAYHFSGVQNPYRQGGLLLATLPVTAIQEILKGIRFGYQHGFSSGKHYASEQLQRYQAMVNNQRFSSYHIRNTLDAIDDLPSLLKARKQLKHSKQFFPQAVQQELNQKIQTIEASQPFTQFKHILPNVYLFNKIQNNKLVSERHLSPQHQKAYDERFGLTIRR